MDGDRDALKKYADDVLERFANPYIKHLLLSITLNSVSKFKTRDLPSLTGYIKKTGKIPAALAFSFASLIAFYEGTVLSNGALTGNRNGLPYPIKDDSAVLERFASLYKQGGKTSLQAECKTNAARIAKAVLSDTAWWGEDLTQYAGLCDSVSASLASIWIKGMKASLEAV